MAMAVQASLIRTDRVVDRTLAIYGAHLERAIHVPLGAPYIASVRSTTRSVPIKLACTSIAIVAAPYSWSSVFSRSYINVVREVTAL